MSFHGHAYWEDDPERHMPSAAEIRKAAGRVRDLLKACKAACVDAYWSGYWTGRQTLPVRECSGDSSGTVSVFRLDGRRQPSINAITAQITADCRRKLVVQ